jgi:hypothetical protein
MTDWDRSGVSRHLHGGTEETCEEGQGSRCAGTDDDVAMLQYGLRRSVCYLKQKLRKLTSLCITQILPYSKARRSL